MPNRGKILVVDDDASTLQMLEMVLQSWDFQPILARDGQEALLKAKEEKISIVIADVVMPKLDGLGLLRSLKKTNPNSVVILLTAQGTVDIAVTAMKEGALDFLTKPVDHAKLRILVERSLERVGSMAAVDALMEEMNKEGRFARLIGASPKMQEMYKLITNVARSNASVFITGESGTGKELVAQSIHDLSARKDKPFVAINCSAIPDTLVESEIFGHEKGAFTGAVGRRIGCFELAHEGTLFLDEIAEMPLHLQPKFLRVLENHKVRRLGAREEIDVNVRVLAATNKDPMEMVRQDKLREDLLYRLNVFSIHLPTLRERREDIPLLAQHFINELNTKHNVHVKSFSAETRRLLEGYAWPGNVRELRNAMERSVIMCGGELIEPSHLPLYFHEAPLESRDMMAIPFGVSALEAEKQLILKTLERTGNNKAEAARMLSLDVKTIRNKLKSYNMPSD